MSEYADFLASKTPTVPNRGIEVEPSAVNPMLFGWQRDIVRWALRKGRSALFEDCGLGKTFQQIEWARLLDCPVLILAPLAVAQQTVREAAKLGVTAQYVRRQQDIGERIAVTNYQMLDKFDPASFGAVVLDESGILKNFEGKTRARLIEAFRDTPYRLCCTATPAPNDHAEIANHAEFLGIMTRAEMLATYFVHDDCFVGSTPVETPRGQREIQDIRVGDFVLNAHGIDTVVGISRKKVTRLVAVEYGGQKVLCSARHLWLTTKGWVEAQSLQPGDSLVTRNAAMRMVRDGISGSDSGRPPEQRTFLQSILLGEMAHEPAGVRSVPGFPTKENGIIPRDQSVLRIGDTASRGTSGKSTAIQAIRAAGSGRPNQRDIESEGHPSWPAMENRPAEAWGQWSRADCSAVEIVPPSRRGLGDGEGHLPRQTASGLSQLLSRRSVLPGANADCRSGRSAASTTRPAGTGPEEGCPASVLRVDRITVYERGCPEFDRESAGDDSVTLYDLTIREHPSFSINGALVHNCGWRLKGHARQPFYRWLASWAMSLRKPSDLGYPDDGFDLPPLTIEPVIIPTDYAPPDQLFFTGLKGIGDRARVRRVTAHDRVFRTAQLVNRDTDHRWIIWCGLNDEQRSLHRLIAGAVSIEGSDSLQEKEDRIGWFLDGSARVLISKPSIIGHGLNLQCASRMAFVGLSDSYEQYYQAIRRSWRFGQARPVTVSIVLSDVEESIHANVLRKERDAEAMAGELIVNVAEFEKTEIGRGTVDNFTYREDEARGDGWTLKLGDSSERLGELAGESVDLSIFSPPFAQLYTYTASERDVGNGRDYAEFFAHFSFITRELRRVTKPGRIACVHCQQLASHLASDGVIGMKDFRGDLIRHFVGEDWTYHGEVCIDKNPQAQAIRTHSKGLLFKQFRIDSSWSRPAFADYILLFRKPGENAVPVHPELTNDEWIEYAHPVWYGIKESDTLNVAEARSQEDERHICPLQLGTIERCVKLWSNRGETVLSPFAGIGSEGYEAIRLGRKFWGCELKPEYWRVAAKNLRKAEMLAGGGDLFSLNGVTVG